MSDNKILDGAGLETLVGLVKKYVDDEVESATSDSYIKPSTGIPESDLTSAVQTSLGLADTAVQRSGDTMTGRLQTPSFRNGNTVYNVVRANTTTTPVETIVYTGIVWLSSKYMPVLHFHGYAYGEQSPIEFKVGFYIYNGNIGWCGATNMGAWKPDIYLFKYTSNDVDYVGVGLKGSCYFLQFSVDIQEEMTKLAYINTTGGWSVSFSTTEGAILTACGATTLPTSYSSSSTICYVPYKKIFNNLANITFKMDDGSTLGSYTGLSDLTVTIPTVAGATGATGADGADGADGEDGEDGVGVSSIAQTTTSSTSGGSNIITCTLTDGTTSTFTIKNGSKGATGATGADGEDGVGVSSIVQTTTSSSDGGSNVITCTLTDGTTSTFTIKNGSKGSTGATGATGAQGDTGERGTGLLCITTEPSAESIETPNGTSSYKLDYLTVTNESGVSEVLVGDALKYSSYCYPVIFVDTDYVYAGAEEIFGATGERGTGLLTINHNPTTDSTNLGELTSSYKIDYSTVINDSGVSEVLVGDTLRYSFYCYPVIHVDDEYVYTGERESIRGATGSKGSTGADGADGVGVSSITQTTTSSADGGSNIVTCTLTDGTTSTFTVRNGSKGSTGATGANGTDGEDGVSVTGATAGTTSQSDGYTITPITFSLSDGSTKTINVQAKNGADGTDGSDASITIDTALSSSSTNAVQNKVVQAALSNKADLSTSNVWTATQSFNGLTTFSQTIGVSNANVELYDTAKKLKIGLIGATEYGYNSIVYGGNTLTFPSTTGTLATLDDITSASSSFPELNDTYVRIWDLDVGIYKWSTTNTTHGVYYNGATDTSNVLLICADCYLMVQQYSSAYKHWTVIVPSISTATYMYWGYTSASSGSYTSRNLSNIPSSAVKNPAYSSSQYNIGYYYTTSNLTSLNSTAYLYAGEYGIGLSTSGTVANGLPYVPTANRRAVIKTFNPYNGYGNSTYSPVIKQDIFVATDNRSFTRYVTYDGSTRTYGDWIETTPSTSGGVSLYKHSITLTGTKGQAGVATYDTSFTVYGVFVSNSGTAISTFSDLVKYAGCVVNVNMNRIPCMGTYNEITHLTANGYMLLTLNGAYTIQDLIKSYTITDLVTTL